MWLYWNYNTFTHRTLGRRYILLIQHRVLVEGVFMLCNDCSEINSWVPCAAPLIFGVKWTRSRAFKCAKQKCCYPLPWSGKTSAIQFKPIPCGIFRIYFSRGKFTLLLPPRRTKGRVFPLCSADNRFSFDFIDSLFPGCCLIGRRETISRYNEMHSITFRPCQP